MRGWRANVPSTDTGPEAVVTASSRISCTFGRPSNRSTPFMSSNSESGALRFSLLTGSCFSLSEGASIVSGVPGCLVEEPADDERRSSGVSSPLREVM